MKTNTQSQHGSRFDFGTGLQSGETGTIRELLYEINKENRPPDRQRNVAAAEQLKKVRQAATVDNGSLDTVREGIKKILNREVTTRLTERIPLTDLKTVYLLYRCNDDNDIELFGRLQLPHLNRPSLEFRTEGNALGNDSYIPFFDHLQRQLSKEIDGDRLELIHQHIPTRDLMLLEIEKHNARLTHMLRDWLQGDSIAMRRAYQELAKTIDDLSPAACSDPTNDLHEALYTHIRTLPFQHFVYGFETVVQKSSSNIPVVPIRRDLRRFCRAVGKDVDPLLSKVASIDSFTTFVAEHQATLRALVQKATVVPTDGRQFDSLIEPARRILNILSNIHYDKDNDTNTLSPLDCVAALCTSRFQIGRKRPEKIEDDPFWMAVPSQGSNLVRHMDTERPIEDLYEEDFIPHSVLQILYHRFNFICSALLYGMDNHRSFMTFQVARLKKQAEILRSNDVDVISRSLTDLDFRIHLSLMKYDPALQLSAEIRFAMNAWIKGQ